MAVTHPAACAGAVLVLSAGRRAGAAGAQPLTLEWDARPAPAAVVAVEQVERWLHGAERDAFTPRQRTTAWLTLDSVAADRDGTRRVRLTAGALGRAGAGARVALAVSADGRAVREEVTPAPPAARWSNTPDDPARAERRRREGEAARVHAAALVWDLVPPVPAPRRGDARTTAIDRAAAAGDDREALNGERVSTVLGDTTVDGRRLWVVTDRARVRLAARWAPRERTLDTTVTIERTVEGTIVGWSLYDAELGLFRTRVDTTRLAGTAVLRYPADPRAASGVGGYAAPAEFQTPVRYERVRRWTLRDAAAQVALDSARRDSARRVRGGMVIPPPEPRDAVERRLAAGDVRVRDSLVGAWRAARDPDARGATLALLTRFTERTPDGRAFGARLDSLREADGDEGALHDRLVRQVYGGGGIDTADMRRAIAFMADPGHVFALGRARDPLYEDLAQGLTVWPPAVLRVAATPYGPRRACTPAACRMLAAEWPGAREPRLRAVALVARAMLEPKPWGDTVLVRAPGPAAARPPLLRGAAWLAAGAGATWPASGKPSVPPPGANWRAWIDWMNGGAPVPPPPGLPARAPSLRFGEAHELALRYAAARTGRDVVGELRREYAAAATSGAAVDSARLVYGTMLQEMGELRLTPVEVAAALRSHSPARIALARAQVPELLDDSATTVGPGGAATTLVLLDRLLAITLGEQPPWPTADTTGGSPRSGRHPVLHARPEPGTVFVLADGLPRALVARWRGRVTFVTATEWSARPLRAGGVLYRLAPVRRRGPFAYVSVSSDERLARPADAAPVMNAAGTTYYLFDAGGGAWMVVSASSWVT